MKLVIIIDEVKPPIPSRSFDFCAYVDEREHLAKGWSSYPLGALENLVKQLDNDDIKFVYEKGN